MERLPALRNKIFGESDIDFWRNPFDIFRSDFQSMFETGIYETDEGYVVEIEVPGFSKEDISVEISDGVMCVDGERKMPHKNGVGVSRISKRLSVGDLEVATANIENGILKMVFKKEKKEKEVKQVEVS